MRNNLRLSEKLYGALLYLYPKQFRTIYSQQMRLTFRDACQAAYREQGRSGLVALWLPTLLDLFKSVLEVWARQGEMTMLKERLIAAAGPLTILVGLMWVAPAVGDLLLRNIVNIGEAGWDLIVAIWGLLLFLSFVPMLFAVIATRLRFQHTVAGIGRVGLALSVAGGIGVLVMVVATLLFGGTASEGDPRFLVNYGALLSLMSIRIGYILFGIDVLRYRVLPRWNLIPLLLGFTVVLGLPMEWFGVPSLLPSSLANSFLHSALSGGCWILLGIAMLEQKREASVVAPI